MTKLYNEKSPLQEQPKQETLQFLLDYSKSIKFVGVVNTQVKLHLN